MLRSSNPRGAISFQPQSGDPGIVTIAGDHKKSIEYACNNSSLAEALVITEEKSQLHLLVAHAIEQLAVPTPPSQSASEATFEPSKDTKQVPLDPANPQQ